MSATLSDIMHGSFSQAIEDEIRYKIEDVEYEDGKPTRFQVIKDLMNDADDRDTIAFTFRGELRDYGIANGIYVEMSQRDIENTQVTRGTVWDFKRNGKAYKFEGWKHLAEKETV